MSFTKHIPQTRIHKEKVTLRNRQLARFISRRKGVSSEAVSQALKIIGEGIVEALAEGFDFQWFGIGTFETRVLKPRVRYNRVKRERYMSNESMIVHFRKSPGLTPTVRDMSIARLNQIVDTPAVKPLERR